MPARYLCGFLTPPVAGADFLAALVANCFLGALPPVDFLAVCLVRAILSVQRSNVECELLDKVRSIYMFQTRETARKKRCVDKR